MTARNAGRKGRPWRRIRAQVLAASTICHLCGHDGADSADHVIPRAIALAAGQPHLLEDIENLAPAHHQPCPTCGIRCNTSRGTGTNRTRPPASRAWLTTTPPTCGDGRYQPSRTVTILRR